MDDKVIVKEIYDNNGRYVGNVVGRKDMVERLNNRDVCEQLKRDEARQKDRQR